MKVLYIGGTGEISTSCVSASVGLGHEVTVFNRGNGNLPLPSEVAHVTGDLSQLAPYALLENQSFDVVCQFLAFSPDDIERDIAYFSGRCGQYIFISSASAYQQNVTGSRITESAPLDNPHMAYSRAKAACEQRLQDVPMTSTIVRPSHTYRARVPSTVIDGNHLVWRLTHGKPVIVHDNGESLWTLTHADDFARAFVRLHGNERALDQVFHITSDDAHRWSDILKTVAAAAGCDLDLRSINSDTLISYIPALEGPLLGDKAKTLAFDNSKIRSVTGGWRCRIGLSEGIAQALALAQQRLDPDYRPDQQLDEMIDRILKTERA